MPLRQTRGMNDDDFEGKKNYLLKLDLTQTENVEIKRLIVQIIVKNNCNSLDKVSNFML